MSLVKRRRTAAQWVSLAGSLSLLTWLAVAARGDEPRWFPVQAVPRGVVRTVDDGRLPEPRPAYRMLLQSVAGLAALAVNDQRGDAMVWVATGNDDIEGWLARWLQVQAGHEVPGALGPWELVERFRKTGTIKGYIVYRADTSAGELNEHRPNMDLSVNVATSLAGLLGGILVEEGIEAEAKRHGLTRLADARGMTQAECFTTYRDRFNRRLLCMQDPRKPHLRDLAIAQRTLTLYGGDPTIRAALKWLEPPAPILGWNGGDEFETTRLSTVLGHFQTATDWCMNLPVLMAGSDRKPPARVKGFDPRTIDWNDRRSAVSFVDTDGDNVQWLEGSFFGNRDYWSSPRRGKVPFGWSCCFAHLAQLCPQAIDRARDSQRAGDTFVEWGGGYYYPDLFGLERPDRWEILARHARRTLGLMGNTGTRIIGFNVQKVDSADTEQACAVFAGQAEGLLAIFLFQYSNYEAGAGRTFWVKDRAGIDVPVVAARYALWEHTNQRPRSGTPAKVAREIRESASSTSASEKDLPRYDWVIAHAWSYFKRAPGTDEKAEDMPQADGPAQGERGYGPVTWCAGRLGESVRVVGPEELVWRIRMKHDPGQTSRVIERLPR